MTEPTVDAFNRALYAEHLEEAAFLRTRRDALRRDERVPGGLVAVEAVEARLLAHADALVVGGTAALRRCHDALPDAEPDLRFAIALVACLARDAELLAASLARAADPAGARAVADALRLVLPPDWAGSLLRAVETAGERWRPLLLEVAGHRRLDAGEVALRSIDAAPREALRTIGRLHRRDALDAVRGLRSHDDRASAEALVARAGADPIAQLALGLCGDARAVAPLAAAASSGSLQAVAALGLLGDGACWHALLALLGRDATAAAAARALQLVAGGGPCVEVHVADAVRPDELTDDERRAWLDDGIAPLRADGAPYGVHELVPSTSADDWRRWAAAHGVVPVPGVRLRWGRPFDAGSALDALAAPSLHPQLRRLAADEFAIRFGRDDGFETDALAVEQRERLAGLRAWAADARLRPGGWPFAGRDAQVPG